MRKQRDPSEAVSVPHESGALRGALAVDSVENALAKGIEAATAAGRWDVVVQLARELEARRLARSPRTLMLAGGHDRR